MSDTSTTPAAPVNEAAAGVSPQVGSSRIVLLEQQVQKLMQQLADNEQHEQTQQQVIQELQDQVGKLSQRVEELTKAPLAMMETLGYSLVTTARRQQPKPPEAPVMEVVVVADDENVADSDVFYLRSRDNHLDVYHMSEENDLKQYQVTPPMQAALEQYRQSLPGPVIFQRVRFRFVD